MLLSLVQPPYHGIVCSDSPAAPTRGSTHEEDGTHRARTHRLGRNPLEGERAVVFVSSGIGEQTNGSGAPDELTTAARFCRPFVLLADGPTEAGTTRLQRRADDPPATPGRPHAPQSSTQRAGPASRRHCPGDTPENATPSTSGAVLATRPASIFADCSSTVPGTGWARGGGRRARGSGTGHASSRKQGATQRPPHPQESTNHVFAPTAHTAGRRLPGVPRGGHLHHLAQRR